MSTPAAFAAPKWVTPSGPEPWESLSTLPEVSFASKQRDQRRVGAPGVLLKGSRDASHPRPLRGRGGDSCKQLRLQKGHGEKAAIVCGGRVGAGRRSPRTLCSAQPPPPPPVSGSPILGGWVGGWLSALPLALKLSTVVPTGGGDRLGVMRASPSRRQFSGPSPRGRPSELPRAVRKLSQRSLSGDGSLLRGTETRRGRSGPALWV